MKIVFDLEGNGLLRKERLNPPINKVWMIVTKDIKTEQEYIFCNEYYQENKKDPYVRPLKAFRKHFDDAEEIIGHNIIQYDLPVMKKILDWVPSVDLTVRDTLLMSQVLNYLRFGGQHSLKLWGEYLGFPKPEHEDWMNYSEDMIKRCRDDVTLSLRVYRVLARELTEFLKSSKNPEYMRKSMRVEHVLAEFQAKATETGWVFNKERAFELKEEMEQQLEETTAILLPKMRPFLKIVAKKHPNGTYMVSKPEYRLDGKYKKPSLNHFKEPGYCQILPEDAFPSPKLAGEYIKVRYDDPDLNSIDHIKQHLYNIGWEPLDWNWEKNTKTGKFTKKSPKVCKESLYALGDDGVMIHNFLSTRSRLGILKGWLASTDEQGRIHGDMFVIGTPTGRSSHKIVVNVPGLDALWGPQMRGLFGVEAGRKVVGADSAGNQFRALCHYIKDDDFTDTVINGDVHQKNADILGCNRPTAKPWIYAFLFGAGLEKLGLILTGKRDKKAGSESKSKFAKAIPGYKDLVDKLYAIINNSENQGRKPSIPALDGRRIYLDSSHKALNYLLQSAEGITCKAAVAYAWAKFKEESIDAVPLIFYHDEMQWSVKEEQAKRAAEISAEAFREAPKWYGVMCMDGESMIGNNWAETH